MDESDRTCHHAGKWETADPCGCDPFLPGFHDQTTERILSEDDCGASSMALRLEIQEESMAACYGEDHLLGLRIFAGSIRLLLAAWQEHSLVCMCRETERSQTAKLPLTGLRYCPYKIVAVITDAVRN